MKKFLATILCVALLLGCLSGVALADEKVSITWLHHFAEEGMIGWTNKLAEEFMALHPECEVIVEQVGASDYDRILKTKIASDDAPMIFDMMNGRTGLREFYDAGHLAVLDDQACIANIDASMLPQGQLDGVQAGIPIDKCGYGCFYNKTIFAELGLEEPTTWDEFIAVLDALKASNYTPISSPYGESWCIVCASSPFYYQTIDVTNNPTWWSDKQNLTSTFADDTAFKDGISKFITATIGYCEDDPYGTSAANSYYKLANGEAAIVINGSWVLDGCNSLNPDADLGVFAIPMSNDTEAVMYMAPGNLLCLYNSADEAKMEYGRMFFDYIYSKDSGTYYAQIARRMTCVTDVDLSEFPNLTYMQNYSPTLTTIGMDTFSSEFQTSFIEILSSAMTDYLENGGDVNALVDQMCVEMDEAFASIAQ